MPHHVLCIKSANVTNDGMHKQLLLHLPQTGATPLYIAAQKNHVDTAGVLLAAGANVDLATKVRQY